MTQVNRELLEAIYKAWRKGDLETLGRHFAGDIHHNIRVSTEIHPLGGVMTGKVQVLDRIGAIDTQFAPVAFAVEELLVGKDSAAAQVRVARLHKISGEQYRSVMAQFWTFRDGLAARIDEYHDMADVLGFTERSLERV